MVSEKAVDWYRQPMWTDEARTEFWRRWERARKASRAQYLRIQAIHLIQTGTEFELCEAIVLLDKLLDEFGDSRTEIGPAWRARGDALLALNELDAAIASYRRAIEYELHMPYVLTGTRLELLYIVALHQQRHLYQLALQLFEARSKSEKDAMFPILTFKEQAALAFILADTGDAESARDCARRALQHASSASSRFPRHRRLGLVGDLPEDIHARLTAIAQLECR